MKINRIIAHLAMAITLCVYGLAQNATPPGPVTIGPAEINSISGVVSITGALRYNVTTITNAASPYPVAFSDAIENCDPSSGAVEIDLPPATGSGRVLIFKIVSAPGQGNSLLANNACTVAPAGTDVIDGTASPMSGQILNLKVSLVDASAGSWIRL